MTREQKLEAAIAKIINLACGKILSPESLEGKMAAIAFEALKDGK